MYYECRNKQFEGKKNRVTHRRVGGKIIIKRINYFISRWRVSVVVGGFVNEVLKKQWPNGIFYWLCRDSGIIYFVLQSADRS